MRGLNCRRVLHADTATALAARTADIVSISDPAERKAKARQIFNSARSAKWFGPVTEAIRAVCGEADVCMYCSANEPSQIEHYRPLAVFPEQALCYENYLWTCDICNRSYKGSRFPPDTEPGEMILNPIDDYVWDYFFIDEQYGRLIKRVDPTSRKPIGRAVSTCEVIGIDRESVQIRRAKRFKALRRDVVQSLSELETGKLSQAELRSRIAEWVLEPFQADVADYFLNGPGREKDPFRTIVTAAALEPDQALPHTRHKRPEDVTS